MIIRILGRIFFLFYICPALRRVASYTVKYTVEKVNHELKQMQEKDRRDSVRSRANHPAGSRLPRQ